VGSGAFSLRGFMCFTIPGIFYRSAPSDLGFDFIWRDVEITDCNWCTGSTLLFSKAIKVPARAKDCSRFAFAMSSKEHIWIENSKFGIK
jgi:hypothetical protein